MRAAYEVTFICYSPFSLDIFPRNVQNKLIKFKQFQEKLYHETGVFHLKAPEDWSNAPNGLLFTGNVPRGVFCEQSSQKTRELRHEIMRMHDFCASRSALL